jgi:hypothetical protein
MLIWIPWSCAATTAGGGGGGGGGGGSTKMWMSLGGAAGSRGGGGGGEGESFTVILRWRTGCGGDGGGAAGRRTVDSQVTDTWRRARAARGVGIGYTHSIEGATQPGFARAGGVAFGYPRPTRSKSAAGEVPIPIAG